MTGFLDPNGSGKSTTMRMILGLDEPDAGEARIGGAQRHADQDDRRRHPGQGASECDPVQLMVVAGVAAFVSQTSRTVDQRAPVGSVA